MNLFVKEKDERFEKRMLRESCSVDMLKNETFYAVLDERISLFSSLFHSLGRDSIAGLVASRARLSMKNKCFVIN